MLWDLQHTVDVANTIITHDAGSPRDQLSPFWEPTTPLSYIGWGKTTQLGYGLGLAMGAKLAKPDKLCINVWGDAAIGFTGMDFETAVRERIPILSILLNNFSMAIELQGHAGLDREVPLHRHLRRLRRDGARLRRLRRARRRSPATSSPAIKRGIAADREGPAGAARVHHLARRSRSPGSEPGRGAYCSATFALGLRPLISSVSRPSSSASTSWAASEEAVLALIVRIER